MVEAYYPETLKEALEIRKNHPVLPYAGGTDIMVRKGYDKPFLFLGGIKELKEITKEKDRIIIGSGCIYAGLLGEGKVPEVLKEAIRGIAAPAIRNIGTIGGNICNASPAGDTLPVLYALGAKLTLESARGEEEIPIEEFIIAPKKTTLKPEQILTKIIIPNENFGYDYKKIGARKAQAISKLSFVGLHKIEDNILKDIRIAFGAVGATVVRNKAAEERLVGQLVRDINIEMAVESYREIVNPIDDQRSTAKYRKTVCMNLLREYLKMLGHIY